MAKNQVPLVNANPKDEFRRDGQPVPTGFTGEIPKKSPIAPDEFRREGSTVPTGILDNNVPDLNPNPDPSFLLAGIPIPAVLPDTNLLT